MYYDRITKAEDVTRNKAGEIQCSDHHYGSGWYRGTTERPAAVDVWVETNNDRATSLVFTCKRHSGTIKAGITKGSWSFRGVRLVPSMTPETAALSPANLLKTLTATYQQERADREAEEKARHIAYSREGWAKAREDYNSPVLSLDVAEVAIGNDDDSFGREFVHVKGGKMTPNKARVVAAAMLAAADRAEDQTAVAVKP